jgi:hypothetical protein
VSQWTAHDDPALDPTGAYHRLHHARRRQRWWTIVLVSLAVLVVGLAIATVVVNLARHRHSAPGPSSSPRASAHHAGRASTSSTLPLPQVTGTPGGPTISSISPSQGSPGQTIVITGTNLFSSTGQVLAYFGSEVAPTACSSQTSCTATVPPATGNTNQVDVTVRTDAGSSNGVPFTYQ